MHKNQNNVSIRIDPVVNLGNIPVGKFIKVDVCFQNTEKKNLSINYVRTPCECLTVYFQQNSIFPNYFATLNFNYQPRAIGYVENNIFIYFKNNDTPIHFLIKANVKDTI